MCGSYNDDLSLQNSTKHRQLLLSPWYQKYWGKRFKLTPEQNAKSHFNTSAGGSRISTSARGSLLGVGGDMVIIDDPHNMLSVESDAERLTARTWWREISTTRLNDPKQSAIVVIMQRLHEEDVSGVILSSEWGSEWTHLCVPQQYEWRRHCVTSLGWQDPRGLDDNGQSLVAVAQSGERLPRDHEATLELERREGALMWPERFGPKEIELIKGELGPFMASGRLQQSPTPAKGGIFDRQWWQLYESPDSKFPAFDHVIASLDSAFTAKEQNDPSALTIWGIYTVHEQLAPALGVTANPAGAVRATDRQHVVESEAWGHVWRCGSQKSVRVMLVHAWRKHLPFSGPRIERGQHETVAMYKARTSGSWGLMEWVQDTCARFKVEKLLIEAKASGISAAQELRNRYGSQPMAVQLCPVKGDKVARALAVQPMFSQGMIFAPNRDWAEVVINEMQIFPAGRYDDLTDSSTQALKYLRDVGLAQSDKEAHEEEIGTVMHRPRPPRLYPC
jgi:predicted phage terminase large subunit-like protein